MCIWDINSGALVLRCDGCHGQQEVTLVTLDASGKQFITGSRGGDVKVPDGVIEYQQSDRIIGVPAV